MDIWNGRDLMDNSTAHVIVLGNEKGGSGKSTTAFHLAIFLLYQGYKVATIDVDSRQQTLTKYVKNRLSWTIENGLKIPHPTHYHLPISRFDSIKDNQKQEFEHFRNSVIETEQNADFLIIDTPGFDTHLTRLAHSLADILITPLNDSLIDLDVLVRIDPNNGEVVELGHYSRLVQRARRERLVIDGRSIDWVLLRNRISMLASRNTHLLKAGLEQAALRLGCRVADGIAERVIFKSLFPIGLTIFDPLENNFLGAATNKSQASVRNEYLKLIQSLNLPTKASNDFNISNQIAV